MTDTTFHARNRIIGQASAEIENVILKVQDDMKLTTIEVTYILSQLTTNRLNLVRAEGKNNRPVCPRCGTVLHFDPAPTTTHVGCNNCGVVFNTEMTEK